MLTNKNVWTLCLAMSTSSAVNTSLADDYHYVNLLVGDRANGMGGAYTAISDDPAGLFYNPAGIVHAQGSSLSGSMNTFNQTTITYRKVLGGLHDWTRTSSSLLPNYFGVIQPWGWGMIGFSYAVPNASGEDQDESFDNIATGLGTADKFIINYNNDDKTYNFGPSFAMKLSDTFSLGATLYLHQRQQQLIDNTLLIFSNDRVWRNNYIEFEERGIKPKLGLMWSPSDSVSLGMSLSKITIFSSEITGHQSCLGANAASYGVNDLCASGDVVNHNITTIEEKSEYPLHLQFGSAWFHSNALLLSADLSYHSAHTSNGNTREQVINFSGGIEYYFNSTWALRAGIFSDYANTPKISSGEIGQEEHVDLMGLSGSISRFTRNSSLTIGFNYSSGTGQAQIISGSSEIQEVEMSNLGLSLAASYLY